MTFSQICELGFRCPYHRYDDDGDSVCIYPYIRITEKEEDEQFGFPDEMDCPLLEFGSELDSWLSERNEGE